MPTDVHLANQNAPFASGPLNVFFPTSDKTSEETERQYVVSFKNRRRLSVRPTESSHNLPCCRKNISAATSALRSCCLLISTHSFTHSLTHSPINNSSSHKLYQDEHASTGHSHLGVPQSECFAERHSGSRPCWYQSRLFHPIRRQSQQADGRRQTSFGGWNDSYGSFVRFARSCGRRGKT
jgi:hypothetical protein